MLLPGLLGCQGVADKGLDVAALSAAAEAAQSRAVPSRHLQGVGEGIDGPSPKSGRVGISQANLAWGCISPTSWVCSCTLKGRFGGPQCQGTRAQPPPLPPTFPKDSLEQAVPKGDWTCWPLSSFQTAPRKPKAAGKDASRGEDAPSALQKQRAAHGGPSLMGVTSVGMW